MPRERVRTVLNKGSGKAYFAPNGSGGAQSEWTASGPMLDRVGTYERIVDENNRRSRPESPVLHVKIQHFPQPVDNWSDSTSSPYGQGFLEAQPMTDPRFMLDHVFHDPLNELARLAEQRVLAKYASVAESWSLLNNLLEVDDTIALIKNLRKYATNVAFADSWTKKKVSKDLKVRTAIDWRARTPDGSPKYLDWEFGVNPLLDDLFTLYQNVMSVKDRLKQLRKRSGAKRRFSEKVPFSPDVRYRDQYDGGFLEITDVNFRGSARANGSITVSVPALDGLANNLRVMLDVLGVHLDAVTVYDAIPFTWLLDWVFPIGDWLESYADRRWIRPSVVFEEGSISYNIMGSCTLKMQPSSGYPGWRRKEVGTIMFRKYERTSFQPTLRGKIEGNMPDFHPPRLTPERLAILAGLSRAI